MRRASAEDIPHAEGGFDAALAQLVVHFMPDPLAGLREMARVTKVAWRGGGVRMGQRRRVGTAIAAVARGAEPRSHNQRRVRRGRAREGHLAELAWEGGLSRVESSRLTVEFAFDTFEEWWETLTLGVGSDGAYVRGLEEADREALQARLERALGLAPFTVSASAWCIRAEVTGSN